MKTAGYGFSRLPGILLTYAKNILYAVRNSLKKQTSRENTSMVTDAPPVLRLKDYREPDFTTDKVDLNFDIHDDHTVATSKVKYTRTAEGAGKTALVLNAENPNPHDKFLLSVKLNGIELAPGTGYDYDAAKDTLTLTVDPGETEVDLEVQTYLEPQNNKKLEGLYKSESTIVSQCESEGFRRITPFLDRPDVLATYTVRVEADQNDLPVLMVNGNKIAGGKLSNGRHWATFQDPWPKPCYLFATANGDLECVADVFTTKSGRKVNVRVYTEKGQSQKGRHALDAVKQSMKWDEDVFDCEYDLDNFNVVAVAKFNFGAMENKGLNVFRDSLLMADPSIATDTNYQRIIDIIGHEYFHNWSGNRVTVKNWFFISLKEGLTVLREQMFTAFTTSAAAQRIQAVQLLRARQFPSDDSPLVHPVLPQEVQSIENCYTTTIYEKGAEVLRMMGELMGREKLIEGIKHYFKTYDGQAVTIHEFAKAMEHVSGLKLDEPNQFFLWYTQSGRPRVKAQGTYDPVAKTYTLTLEQKTPSTKDQPVKQPLYIPVRLGLVDDQGQDILPEQVLHFNKSKQTFVLQNVGRAPAFHSLFRGFSAPVDCDPGLSEDQLYKQFLSDPDGFNRWDAGQKIGLLERKRLYDAYLATGALPPVSARYIDTIKTLANDNSADQDVLALTLTPPSIKEFESAVGGAVSPSAVNAVLKHVRQSIARALYSDFQRVYDRSHDGQPYSFDYASVGKRHIKGVAMGYLSEGGASSDLARAKDQYFNADNMTDKMMAMAALNDHLTPERDAVMDDFYATFSKDVLVIQKWFALQAGCRSDGVIASLKGLTAQKNLFDWSNPGHVQSVFGSFAGNYEQFHRADGKGYEFLADAVIKMNEINPKVSSGLIGPLCDWRKYTPDHQKLMVAQLERIAATPKLETDVKEKLLKSLPEPQERKNLGLPAPRP